MCKVMMLTNGSKIKNIKQVVNKAAELITTGDDDGFGWLGQTSSGIMGERTVLTKNFKSRLFRPKLINKLKELPFVELSYEWLGVEAPITGSLMFHGRTSTNDINLKNTHPISKLGWNVIHNGVVTNKGPYYVRETTNDTEHIAHYLATEGIKGVEKNLSGYYAIGAFDPQGFMHVIRDDAARLVVTYSPTIDSFIYGTTEDLVRKLCSHFKWQYEPIMLVKDNIHIIFKGNQVMHYADIKPIGMETYWERDMQGTSLHYLNRGVNNASSYPSEGTAWEDIEEDRGYRTFKPKSAEESAKAFASIGDSARTDIDKLEDLDDAARYYHIIDPYDKEITYQEFKKLNLDEKLNCIFTDPVNGEVVDIFSDQDMILPIDIAKRRA